MRVALASLMAFFARIDSAVERRFRALFHALMRRGVGRATIRLNLWGMFILAFVFRAMGPGGLFWAEKAGPCRASILIATALFVGVIGYRVWSNYELDVRVDALPGVLSPSDTLLNAAALKAQGYAFLTAAVSSTIDVGFGTRLINFSAIAFEYVVSASFLGLAALCFMPPPPPARQARRVPLFAAPEGA